jgi:hypothetical protein
MERGIMTSKAIVQKVLAMTMAVFVFCSVFAVFLAHIPLNVKSDLPFTGDVQINDDAVDQPQNLPDLAVGTSGMVYSVWEDMRNGTDFNIYFSNSSDGGQTWSANVKVNTGSNDQTNPKVAVNQAETEIYVVWQDRRRDRDIYFAKSTNGGLGWTDPNIIINDNLTNLRDSPDIAVDSSGTIHVVWEDTREGNWDIFHSKSSNGGTSWSPNTRVNVPSSADQRRPTLAVDSLGYLYVAWHDNRASAFDYDIYFANSTDGGLSWSLPNVRVNNDGLGNVQENPSIAVISGGTVYVVWDDYRDLDANIYFARSTDWGVTWPTNTRVNDLSTSNQQFSDIAVSSGIISVVWEDFRDPDANIYFSNSSNGGTSWGSDIRVNENTPGPVQYKPTIAASPGGTLHVAWEDDRNSGSTGVDIYSTSLVSVAPAPITDSIVISLSDDGSTGWASEKLYKVSESDTYYAIGWNDTLKVYTQLESVTWSVSGGIGTVNAGPSSSTLFTATTQGIGKVMADHASYPTNETGLLTVTGGDIDRVFISLTPDGSTNWIGDQYYSVSDTQTFYAVGWNDTLNESVTLVAVGWNTSNAAVGTVSAFGTSTTFTAQGDGTCVVTIDNGTWGTNDTGVLTVTSYTVDRFFISLSPVPSGISDWLSNQLYPEGESDFFYACGWNDTQNVFVKLIDSTWISDDPLVGTVTDQGTFTEFTAINEGTCKVTANNITFGSNTTDLITVFSLKVDKIIVSFNSDGTGGAVGAKTYAVFETDLFYATGWNLSYNQFIGLVDVTWSSSNVTIGSVDSSGTSTNFTALWIPNDSTCTVTAQYLSYSDSTGILTVLKPTVDYITIRDAANNAGNVLDEVTFDPDDTATYFAASYNETVDYLGDISTAQWIVTNGIGSVSPATGNSTIFTALNEGIGKITVSYNGITNESGNITVNERVNPPPAQPDQPTLVVIGGEQINITWPENTESDLKEYVIQRSENATGPWTNISIISAGNNSFSDSELVPGTTYYYRIIAVDTEGNPSNASQVTSATTEKKINGNGGDDFPWIIVIIIIVVVLLLIFLLIFIIKKKQGV